MFEGTDFNSQEGQSLTLSQFPQTFLTSPSKLSAETFLTSPSKLSAETFLTSPSKFLLCMIT